MELMPMTGNPDREPWDKNGYNPREVCKQAKDAINKFGGIKFDSDKLRWDLLPMDVCEGIVRILTYGAKKYKPNNWQKVEMWRYIGAFMRHWVAWLLNEDKDPESGEHHLDHALCNLFFIRWKTLHDG